MAHFRAVIRGNRGEASRLGTKRTGIVAKVQTWGHDLNVDVSHVTTNGWADDVATVEVRDHSTGLLHSTFTINLTTGERWGD